MMSALRVIAAAALLLVAAVAAPAVAQEAAPTTVIYLVRHAEKADDGTQDPPLTEAGVARAQLLTRMLADAGITAVYSTPYRRTRETAAPVAAALGLTVREYDPRAGAEFAERLRGAGGRHLVIGHSNTIPELVRLLGGVAEPMTDAEYGRVYEVTIEPGGVRTVVLGYVSYTP